uniref:Uroporphyrin-III C-methyltransferase n=1 Tax=Kalmanozyma brasiliensis (strain GHG001) TaxID=1365824 RepID=V5GF09_KALBG
MAKRQSEASSDPSTSDPTKPPRRKGRKNGTSEIEEEDLSFDATPLNSPVPQLAPKNPLESVTTTLRLQQLQAQHEREQHEAEERTKRRMRWVAQISEYWPIEYLGNLGEGQMDEVLRTHGRGHIYLLGSGPGHPGLLTTFAYRLLTSPTTSLILSDKLVPSSILNLIPSSTPLEIARKFPGNAEGAQSELIAKALRAASEGKTVVRLKQGDPFVYGRGGEEVLAFRAAGCECTVVPGISSAIAAPALLGIPVTQRGAADSLVLCTGVGKGGGRVKLPGYERGRTVVVLMGVARLRAVVATLTEGARQSTGDNGGDIGDREGGVYPPYTPIAIIERASSSDQRMVASTLEGIVEALENSGEQRPPGMMVIGWSVLSLEGKGDVTVQDDALSLQGEELERRDRERVSSWLKGRRWIVREGLDQAYRSALTAFQTNPLQFSESPLVHHADSPKEERFNKRDEAGWAPPRYPTGVPEGGWMAGEAPNRPATDQIAYEQDKTYAEIQARLREW